MTWNIPGMDVACRGARWAITKPPKYSTPAKYPLMMTGRSAKGRQIEERVCRKYIDVPHDGLLYQGEAERYL
jgi:hypothetical protein